MFKPVKNENVLTCRTRPTCKKILIIPIVVYTIKNMFKSNQYTAFNDKYFDFLLDIIRNGFRSMGLESI